MRRCGEIDIRTAINYKKTIKDGGVSKMVPIE
jgi:hypothetical protein